jgi:glycosyltransferase involved in cell wall biosynthesis
VISFVVPAYNEEKYLAPTLAAIHQAARAVGEPYEIVVANDNSSDATAQVARDGGARVVDVHKRQIAGTRNAGARAAQGEWLVFVDADTQVTEPVVRGMVEAFRSGVVGGGAGVRFLDGPPWIHRWIVVIEAFFRWIKWAAGCFVFARRDAFEAIGGFDEAFYASEEIHFSRALKRQGRFVVLRDHVITSGRKAEKFSRWQTIKMLVPMLVRGPGGAKSRELTREFWYPDKR